MILIVYVIRYENMDIFAPRLLVLLCLLTLVMAMHHEKCTMNKKHLQLKTTRNIVSHDFQMPFLWKLDIGRSTHNDFDTDTCELSNPNPRK